MLFSLKQVGHMGILRARSDVGHARCTGSHGIGIWPRCTALFVSKITFDFHTIVWFWGLLCMATPPGVTAKRYLGLWPAAAHGRLSRRPKWNQHRRQNRRDLRIRWKRLGLQRRDSVLGQSQTPRHHCEFWAMAHRGRADSQTMVLSASTSRWHRRIANAIPRSCSIRVCRSNLLRKSRSAGV